MFIEDDEQVLTYSISGTPSFMNWTATQDQVTFTGNATDVFINDTFTITISASDGYSFSTFNYTVSVIENKPPQPPAVEWDFLLHEGDSGIISLSHFVDYEGDDILYTCVIKDTTDNCNSLPWISDFNDTSLEIDYSLIGMTMYQYYFNFVFLITSIATFQ